MKVPLHLKKHHEISPCGKGLSSVVLVTLEFSKYLLHWLGCICVETVDTIIISTPQTQRRMIGMHRGWLHFVVTVDH